MAGGAEVIGKAIMATTAIVTAMRERRVHAKLGKNRFATQIYSRLTNANPELVLAFMRAGQGHRPTKVSVPQSTLETP